MTNFLHWRKMTWTLVLWSAYIATVPATSTSQALGMSFSLIMLMMVQQFTP